jgi:hypothetical protein
LSVSVEGDRMKDVKEFVEKVLDLAAEDMADGSDYRPHAYFLMPDESVDIFVIDPNFMATARSKDGLRAILLKHLRDRGGVYAVLVSDAWGAVAEMPKGISPEQARDSLPDDLSTFAGRTELLLASVFGEGMEPILAQWPYSRTDGKPNFHRERLRYESAASGTKVSGRFAPDLSGGKKSS